MPIEIGDVLGDYQVTGLLGRGGMGKVFRVRSLLTDREEAMKVVLPDLDDNPALADRFLREIKLHASLQHPNIAALHAALRIENRLVMILELVEGASLEERLRHGPLPVPEAAGYIAQVLAALSFAHDRRIIHRDIKPANILIAAGGVVKLTDFGIAHFTGAARLTGAGLALGTLAYMSPEQIRSGEIDGRSDIYSLGLTFYEMVAGHPAFAADTAEALMNAQLNLMPPEPAMAPPAIGGAIMRAIAKQPERRFQTAAEFAAALGHAPPRGIAPDQAELARLENALARAIGPIARRLVAEEAGRHGTISEIRQALAIQIENPKAREEFLSKPYTDATMTIERPTTAPVSFDSAVLDRLTRALAPYLGPIAKVMVGRAARSARGVEDLENALAAEIPDPADRRRFLATARSASQ
jgi:serine/threonine protein kinase